ncbi:two component transcriptional regulator, LuxR family [Filimonas lacunae]|uniref:Two component transcriptional regulator, LuxR family n=1 Tax=Filimonas lacunae TaxID=477680 RepID=A0A173MMK6_9BACT|nr:response regulator transcription factor [Filimonas lacunae]BAV08690.1 DNA-binding response regulator, LuxR family [Filimonas lacunae]SIS60019.1 two component transcriptional regulator, LuxR family [Filimonas lacunae]
MTNILIAEDHAIVRLGISILLKNLYPGTNVLEVDDFNEAIKIINQRPIDLIILDINIPNGNSTQMIDTMRARQPEIRILIFSAYDEELYAQRYIEAGANGFLSKGARGPEIDKAIKTVLNSDIYASEFVKQSLLQRLADKNTSSNPLQNLSNRETEVMQLLIDAKSVSEISSMLNLQISTVSTYRKRIFEKLSIKNIVELIQKYRSLTP